MFKVLRDWIQRYFSDEEAVVLAVLLFLAFTAVLTLGGMLAPVLAGMVLAYLMQGLVTTLERLFAGPNREIENGVLPLGSREIAQLDTDPSVPEHGTLTLVMGGGR